MSKTKRRGLSFGVLPRYRHPHPERVLPLPVTLRAPETPNQLELLTEERLTSTLDRVTQLTVSLDELPETLVSCRGMTYRLTPKAVTPGLNARFKRVAEGTLRGWHPAGTAPAPLW